MHPCPEASFVAVTLSPLGNTTQGSLSHLVGSRRGGSMVLSLGKTGGYFYGLTQRGLVCLKESQETLFLKWIKK